MINRMREMAPTIMIIVLVSFVIGTIFFNWGMNAGGPKNRMSSAGTINGKEIPIAAFDREVSAQRQKLQENGREVPPAQYQMVPKQVWEQEVQRVLIQDVMTKLKIDASAEEVFEYIKQNPMPGIDTASVFQTNGVFDTSKYVQFLNNPQNYDTYPWLRNIEDYTRKMIIPTQKLEKLLNAGAIPTRAEIENEYNRNNSKIVFEYAKVNNFMISVDSAKVNKAAIEKYYTDHKDSFKVDNQVELYFAKFPKQATAADEEVYKQQLIELKQKIMSSGKIVETFIDEAKIESDDEGSAPNGGDLGWFGKGQMVPEFENVAFNSDTLVVSDPVRSQFGYHIILVESKETKDSTMKVKARHILKKVVPTIETLDMLSEKADSLRSKMQEKDFVSAAKAEPGIIFDSTGLFKKGDLIPKLGYVSGAGQFAFIDEKAKISERLENNEGFYILAVKQRTKKGHLALSEVKSKITEALTDSLRKEAAKEYLASAKAKLVDTMSLATLKDTDPKLMSGVSDTIPVSGFIAGVGNNTKVAFAASALPVGKVSNPIEYKGSFYIVKTLWKQPAAKIDWNSSDVKQITEQIKMRTQQKMYYDWYMDYKKQSKIKSNVEDIYID